MAITYPLFPPSVFHAASIRMTATDIVSVATSPFTGQQQVQAHQGQYWGAEINIPPMTQGGGADDMAAWLTSLRGQYGTFRMMDTARASPRGAMNVLPNTFLRVNGASQTGSTLLVKGGPTSSTAIFKAGDYIQIGGGNDALYSEDFSQSAWVKTGVTVTSNTVTAPDGTTTSDTLSPTTSDSSVSQTFTPTSYGDTYTCTVRIRGAGGGRSLTLYIKRTSDGAIISSQSISANAITYGIHSVSASGLKPEPHTFSIGGSSTFSTGEDIYAWGAQICRTAQGQEPYIKTTAAASTRTARLYKVLRDVDSDSSGNATLEIWPRLRESPNDNEGIKFINCYGTFRLTDNMRGWDVNEAKIYGFTLSAREAL